MAATSPKSLNRDRTETAPGSEFTSTPGSPTSSSQNIKECPRCAKELSWFNRKRTCTLCGTTTCKDCCSKKAIPGEMACRTCIENREIEREFSNIVPVNELGPIEQVKSPRTASTDKSSGSPDSPFRSTCVVPEGYFGVLRVRFIEGRGLIAADTNLLGKRTSSDPYCVMTLSADQTRRVTKVIPTTLNPVWNQEIELPVRVPTQSIDIDVFDKDMSSKGDKIGRVSIPLDRLQNHETLSGWIPIQQYEDSTDSPSIIPQLIPAGALHLAVRLDYRASAEVKGFIEAAVWEPTPQKVSFDVNALYGPGMLLLDLLWNRLMAPVVAVVSYALSWENYLVSLIAVAVWVGAVMFVEYWPSGICFGLNVVMVHNYLKRKFRKLLGVKDRGTGPKGKLAKLGKIPGVKLATNSAKFAYSGVKFAGNLGVNMVEKVVPIGGHASPKSSSTHPQKSEAIHEEHTDEYEEQSLGSAISKFAIVTPAWIKELLAGFQPTVRTITNTVITLYDIVKANHEHSLLVFVGLLVMGVKLLFVPFKYVLAFGGGLGILMGSPVMRILLGLTQYMLRPKRFNSPAKIGMWKEVDPEWMSADSVIAAAKKRRSN